MYLFLLLAVCCFLSPAVWAAEATNHTTVPSNGTTVFSPNVGEIGVIGPYGYQPPVPNMVIGPVAPVGPVENTPITTAPPAGNADQGSSGMGQVQSVYGDCYTDDQGKSVHALISWECHAANGTVISAGSCQAPVSIMPCN